jgi:hypothetical protein
VASIRPSLVRAAAAAGALSLGLWIAGFAPNELKLQPSSEDAFYAVPPNTLTPLTFRVLAPDGPDADVSYRISNYAGKPTKQGTVRAAQGKLALQVKLPEGYYELAFSGADQTFGFTVAPKLEGPDDAFFGLDAALSWLVSEPAHREALVRVLAKSGIGIARERLSWTLVEPALGRWDWEAKHKYDEVRRIYRSHGVKLLECLVGSPGNWDFAREFDPLEATRYAGSMTQVAQHWGDVWGAIEVGNEIDLRLVDAARYVRLLRTVHAGVSRMPTPTPVLAGAFAKFNEHYLDQLADAGMLTSADALSIHPYGTSAETREMLQQYRGWTSKHGHPDFPIWISESGRAWPRGPARPALVDDARSAKANTIRGILARSEHASAYFPFVLPYFEEKSLNYGLTDRSFTPLRSFAAYATSVRMLSHAKVVAGEDVAGARESYAFERGSSRVLVVYTNDPAQLAAPRGLTGQVFGIDGRDLGAVGKTIAVPDGLSYVVSPIKH